MQFVDLISPPALILVAQTRDKLLDAALPFAAEMVPGERISNCCGNAGDHRAWQKFLAQRELAHKIVHDQEHPGGRDRTLSTSVPDARCGKHGQYFDG